MKTTRNSLIALLLFSLVFPALIWADGISVDAGITPAENRWIIRTLMHYMQRDTDPAGMDRSMESYMFNTVFAYGLRRDITLMIKQPWVFREMTMPGRTIESSGNGDLSLMVKYGIYRKNTRDYIFGIATTVAVELATGSEEVTNGASDLKPGIYMSYRRGRWSSDLSLAYSWKGFTGETNLGTDPGDELAVDFATSYKFSLGSSGTQTLAPVLELSYRDIASDSLNNQNLLNSGESVVLLSPGLKYTRSSLILEGLVQLPVYQDQDGLQLERGPAAIVGLRYMF